jgi:hypothetical protein
MIKCFGSIEGEELVFRRVGRGGSFESLGWLAVFTMIIVPVAFFTTSVCLVLASISLIPLLAIGSIGLAAIIPLMLALPLAPLVIIPDLVAIMLGSTAFVGNNLETIAGLVSNQDLLDLTTAISFPLVGPLFPLLVQLEVRAAWCFTLPFTVPLFLPVLLFLLSLLRAINIIGPGYEQVEQVCIPFLLTWSVPQHPFVKGI